MLMQKPGEHAFWNEDVAKEASKRWRYLYARAVESEEKPPRELVQCFRRGDEDTDTSRALSLLDALARRGEGEKVWAGLKFLGLIPGPNDPRTPVITEEDRA